MKKVFGFSSCVKPFAQQKWFLVASKTKCSEHSRKHINRSVPFLRLWSFISLFFFLCFFPSFLSSHPPLMLSLGKDQAEYSGWKSWLSFSILLGFALVLHFLKRNCLSKCNIVNYLKLLLTVQASIITGKLLLGVSHAPGCCRPMSPGWGETDHCTYPAVCEPIHNVESGVYIKEISYPSSSIPLDTVKL